MVDETATRRGRIFEEEAVAALGLTSVPGSGNQWHSLSDGQGRIRMSCKSTSKRSWAETRRQLAEAIDLAQGTGETPVLAIEDQDGERILILRLSDGASLLTEETRGQRKVSRADVVRDVSRVPVLLREGEDE